MGALASLLVWSTGSLFKLDRTGHWRLAVLVFFSALFVYNLDRLLALTPDRENVPQRSRFIASRQMRFYVWLILSLFMIVRMASQISRLSLLFLTVLFFISAFYLYAFSYTRKAMQALKHLAWIKPALLALVWSSVTVMLPVVESHGHSFASSFASIGGLYRLYAIRFFHYMANGIFFDLRDREGDRIAGKLNFSKEASRQIVSAVFVFFLGGAALLTMESIYHNVLPPVTAVELFVPGIYFWLFFSGRLSVGWGSGQNMNKKTNGINELFFIAALDGPLFLPVIYLF